MPENNTTETEETVTTEETHENVAEDTPSSDTIPSTIPTAPEITSPTAGPGVTEITDAMLAEYLKANDPLVIELKKKFEQTINSLDFLVDESWVERASNGLNKPNLDERLEAQYLTNAGKDLRNKAGKEAERTGKYVAPTKEQIQASADKKMEERKLEIQGKKDQKIAKAKAAILAGKQ